MNETTPQRRQQQQQLWAGTIGDQDGQGPRPGDRGQDRQSQRRGEDLGAKGQENGTAGQVRRYLIIDSKYYILIGLEVYLMNIKNKDTR